MYTTPHRMMKNISRAIIDYFGEGYRTYCEKIEQGLNEPCFLITIINNAINYYASSYYKVNMSVMVQYIENDVERAKLDEIEVGLFECLENIKDIKYDTVFASKNKQSSVTIEENILNFSLEFEFFLRRQEAKDYMEGFENHINIKEVDINE